MSESRKHAASCKQCKGRGWVPLADLKAAPYGQGPYAAGECPCGSRLRVG